MIHQILNKIKINNINVQEKIIENNDIKIQIKENLEQKISSGINLLDKESPVKEDKKLKYLKMKILKQKIFN